MLTTCTGQDTLALMKALQGGAKIEAIKMLRSATGLGIIAAFRVLNLDEFLH